jgi:hypothetical protein
MRSSSTHSPFCCGKSVAAVGTVRQATAQGRPAAFLRLPGLGLRPATGERRDVAILIRPGADLACVAGPGVIGANIEFVSWLVESQHSEPWQDWYHFARLELRLNHVEAVEYANRRVVEEQSRRVLGETTADPLLPPAA